MAFTTEYKFKLPRGFVDAVIRPRETRRRIITALALAANKRDWMPPKKHGNIPM